LWLLRNRHHVYLCCGNTNLTSAHALPPKIYWHAKKIPLKEMHAILIGLLSQTCQLKC